MRFLEHLELEKKLGLASMPPQFWEYRRMTPYRPTLHMPTFALRNIALPIDAKKNKSKVIRKSEANTLDVSKGRRSQFVVFEAQRYLPGRCGFFEGQSKMYFFGLFSLVYVSEYQARTRLRVRL